MKKTKGRNQNGEPKLVPAGKKTAGKKTNKEHEPREGEDCWPRNNNEEGEKGEKNVGCTDEEGARKKKGFF